MTTIEERREMIQKAEPRELITWFELYSERYKPLENPNKDIEETYKMIKEEIMRRMNK